MTSPRQVLEQEQQGKSMFQQYCMLLIRQHGTWRCNCTTKHEGCTGGRALLLLTVEFEG